MSNLPFLLLFLGLILAPVQAQKMHTYALGPSFESYDQDYAWYFGFTSDVERICSTGFICDDRPLMISWLLEIYKECGFHSFQSIPRDYIFSSNVTNQPHHIRQSIFIQNRQDLELIDCVLEYNPLKCLPPKDVNATNCVTDRTKGKKPPMRLCLPWWGLTVILALVCAGLAILIFFMRERCYDKSRYLAPLDLDDDTLHEELLG
jgi:hypothetical protein